MEKDVARMQSHFRAVACASNLAIIVAVVVFLFTSTWGGCETSDEVMGAVPAAPTAASEGVELCIPAGAHWAGAQGTNWRTDLEVHNPGETTAAVTVDLLKRDIDNSAPMSRSFNLAAGRSVRYGDVVESLFGYAGAAGFRLRAPAGKLIATSRTFNDQTTGTYGQFVPSYAAGEAIVSGQRARLIQLTHNPDLSAGYRTNIGFVNAGSTAITLMIDLYDAAGVNLGTVTEGLRPFEYRQIDRIFERVTAGAVADGYAVLSSSNSGARFFAYASVIDNRTGDPIYLPAVAETSASSARASVLAAGDVLWVPAGAHWAGAQGTDWRTDLEVHNPGAVTASFVIALLKRGADNSSPTTVSLNLAPGRSVRYADVVDSLFDFAGAAAFRLSVSAGTLMASSRTFNNQPAGTYGQFVPAALDSQAVGSGQEARLIQLTHDPDLSAGYRTNIGFVSAVGSAITLEIDLYTADGVLLGTVTETLKPFEYRQIDKIFERVTGGSVADGYAVLSSATAGARFFAYASVIDNRTGDPVLVPAFRVSAGGTPPVVEGLAIGTVDGANTMMSLMGLAEVGPYPTLESYIRTILQSGMESLHDVMAVVFPTLITKIEDGFVVDFGSGYTTAQGTELTGKLTATHSNLVVSGSEVSWDYRIDNEGFTKNGAALPLGSITGSVSADPSDPSFATGEVTINASGAVSSAAVARHLGVARAAAVPVTMTGNALFDTRICRFYPISGRVDVTVGADVKTIRFNDSCNGGYDYEGPPLRLYALMGPVIPEPCGRVDEFYLVFWNYVEEYGVLTTSPFLLALAEDEIADGSFGGSGTLTDSDVELECRSTFDEVEGLYKVTALLSAPRSNPGQTPAEYEGEASYTLVAQAPAPECTQTGTSEATLARCPEVNELCGFDLRSAAMPP